MQQQSPAFARSLAVRSATCYNTSRQKRRQQTAAESLLGHKLRRRGVGQAGPDTTSDTAGHPIRSRNISSWQFRQVGRGSLELSTSRMSSVRSNQTELTPPNTPGLYHAPRILQGFHRRWPPPTPSPAAHAAPCTLFTVPRSPLPAPCSRVELAGGHHRSMLSCR